MICLNFATVGWAMNLMAGEGTDSTEYSFFEISMRLTDAGHGLFSSIFVYLNQHNYFNLNNLMFFKPLMPICFISEHMEDIVGLIFQYLLLLKQDGVQEWIFNEVRESCIVYILCKIIL